MKAIYNVLIVDDEPYAHHLLESYCNKLDHLKIIGNCYNGLEALAEINQQQVDIMLLDIQMPEISGIELLDTIQSKNVKVVMITAYSDAAIETYNYDLVIDYLLKPIKFTRFVKAIERVKKMIALEKNDPISSLATDVNDNSFNSNSPNLYLKDGKTIHKIPHDSVLHIQSYGNYVKLFFKGGKILMIRNTLSNIEKELAPFGFCRIHKSFLVNLSYVSKVGVKNVQLQDVTLPLGSNYSEYFKEKFLK